MAKLMDEIEAKVYIDQELQGQINQVIGDYQAYLDGLPAEIQPLMAPMPQIEEKISPGRLSVLALPFWLGQEFKIDDRVSRRISLANIFGLLHFMALDKLIDGDSPPEQIAAVTITSTIYQQQLMACYQAYFRPDSPFWPLMEKYWLEWAGSMVWERKARVEGRRASFSAEDLLRSARKAAPLKICTSGMALLGGRSESIPDLEAAVDGMHMVMQMMDDLVDMGQDITSDRFNTALNMTSGTAGETPAAITGESLASPSDPALDIMEKIGRRLFSSGEDDVYLAEMQHIASKTQSSLYNLGLNDWADLIGITVSQAQKWRDDHVEWLIEALEHPDIQTI